MKKLRLFIGIFNDYGMHFINVNFHTRQNVPDVLVATN